MNIAILCSGVALGVYIPGLYIHRDLRLHSIKSEIFVLETLLKNEKINKIGANKDLFHSNFRAALIGQKLAGDNTENIDTNKTTNIFKYWVQSEYTVFVVLSGFWMPLLEQFSKAYPNIKVDIECLHIDSSISPSWEKVNFQSDDARSTWLMSSSKKQIQNQLDIAKKNPIPFSERENKLLLHGGGWGIGTYQSKISQLLESNFYLNVVAYNASEVEFTHPSISYYGIDPKWSPWIKNNEGEHTFPPFSAIKKGETPVFTSNNQYPELFNLTRKVKGVISKPGGSTLLDSLESATPLILLEGFGKHEDKNSVLWQELGFGISYNDWEKTNFDVTILEKLHLNLLLQKEKYPKYLDKLLSRIKLLDMETLS